MSAFLALHLPNGGLNQGRILAVSRDPLVVRAFQTSVLRNARIDIAQAGSELERKLAERKLAELQATFDLVFSGLEAAGAKSCTS